MKSLSLYLLTGASALVFLASLLTWVTFKMRFDFGSLHPSAVGMDDSTAQALQQAMKAEMARTMQQHLTLTGWHGHVTLFGIKMMNWMVPVAAIAVACLAWLRATAVWATPRWVGIVLSVGCVVHLGTLLVVIGGNSETTRLGFGALLAAAGSLGMLASTVFGGEPEQEWVVVRAGREYSPPSYERV